MVNELLNQFPSKYRTINVFYDGNVAYLIFDNPDSSVNKLSAETLKELDHALDILANRNGLKLLVFKSNKVDVFIAGADIEEIKNITDKADARRKVSEGQRILTKIANMQFKTLAIINGACMGGGTELALACTFRVITDNPKAKMALPEVNLGIIPGFGGTQRLPRLIGIVNSLDMILTGRNVDGKKAFKIGLVDDLIPSEYLGRVEKDWVERVVSGKLAECYKNRGKRPIIERIPFSAFLIFKKASNELLKKTGGHYPAPMAALNVVRETHKVGITKGLSGELDAFIDLVVGNVCKNLIGVYYINEELKKEYKSDALPDIENITILGAGVMGGGIAWLFGNSKIPTRMKDVSLQAISIGYQQIYKVFAGLKKIKKATSAEIAQKTNFITHAITDDGLGKSDLIIEAIIEDLGVKKTVLADLESKIDKNTIIVTNTSSLRVSDIAEGLKYKNRFCGMHFFNPVNKMPLVEVIKTGDTDERVIFEIVNLARKVGKVPIVVGDCAGFVVNRILMPLMNEALFCLQECGDVKLIDDTLKEFGLPMGAFELADEIGIDICYKVAHNLHFAYGDRMMYSGVLKKMYDLKLLGKKNGFGFYKHIGGGKILNTDAIKKMNFENKKLEKDEILKRCVYIAIKEAFMILEEGNAKNAGQLDMALIMGAGFPAFRGGLLRYADEIGTKSVLNALQNMCIKYGNKFKPSFLLEKLGNTNEKVYNYPF